MTDSAQRGGTGVERLVMSIAATAAVTCIAILVVLMIQTNKARLQLQQDGVAEFNFVLQLDHNLDLLALAVRADQPQDPKRPGTGASQPLDPQSELIKRFDVLYSFASTADSRWIGGFASETGAPELIERLEKFVNRYDALIQPGAILSEEQLATVSAESLAMAKEVYTTGIAMFQSKSVLRDDLSSRLDWLINASGFFGISFILSVLTLYILLVRAFRRAGELFQQSRSSQIQLETALEELTSGDSQRKAQNRFLAAATHDLRQPLQAMQYYLAALQAHVPEARGQQILENAGRSTDAAQSLLTGLLDISKLDAGVLDIKLADVDLDAIVTRLQRDFLAEAADRGLALHVDAGGIWARTDPQLLERILRNLLANALAYTEAGSVSLTVEDGADGTALMVVEDTGIGIPEHEQEAIFSEYHQVDSTRNVASSGEGMGLGLSIVRRLTRLLDLPLEVQSTVGSGTKFTLRLNSVTPGKEALAARFSERPDPQEQLGGLDLMIIDDEPAVRDGMRALLELHGCRVVEAGSVDEAREMVIACDCTPALILADYQLQDGRTGFDAIECVREEINIDVPAILITGDTSPALLDEARSAGFGLLHKPISSTALFSAIAGALSVDSVTAMPRAR
jgi:signal transduction histidine kinase/CheY-like chemotaxis protein